jgi:integrase
LKRELHPLAEDFYKYLLYDKSRGTAINYAGNVDKFLRFVDKPLGEITPLDVTRWYESLEDDYSPRTIWRYGWALRSFFDLMGMQELKRRTPIVEVHSPEPNWMDEETTFKLIGRVPVLCVGYDLALRVGEVGLLRREEFNPGTGEITVTRLKHKARSNKYMLRIDDWCLEILNEYLKEFDEHLVDVIFPMSVPTMQRIFERRAGVLGLEGYNFQSLRHSRITHIAIRELEERGVVDELGLAKFAGHLRVETTRIYVHLAAKHIAFGRRGHGEGA